MSSRLRSHSRRTNIPEHPSGCGRTRVMRDVSMPTRCSMRDLKQCTHATRARVASGTLTARRRIRSSPRVEHLDASTRGGGTISTDVTKSPESCASRDRCASARVAAPGRFLGRRHGRRLVRRRAEVEGEGGAGGSPRPRPPPAPSLVPAGAPPSPCLDVLRSRSTAPPTTSRQRDQMAGYDHVLSWPCNVPPTDLARHTGVGIALSSVALRHPPLDRLEMVCGPMSS